MIAVTMQSVTGVLPLLVLWFCGALIALAVLAIRGRKEIGRWGRLARRYPAAPRGGGTRVWGDVVIFGRLGLRNSTWLEVDAEYLHFYPAVPMGRLRPPFSIPLPEISVEPATWGAGRQPVVRLTFARAPEEPILLPNRIFKRLAAASAGKVQLPAAG